MHLFINIISILMIFYTFTFGEVVIKEAINIDGDKVKVFEHDYSYTILIPFIIIV